MAIKKAKTRKGKFSMMRFRKSDVAHNLLCAAQRWIHAHGGTAVMMSGGNVILMPDDRAGVYYVAVKVLGKPPVKKPGDSR